MDRTMRTLDRLGATDLSSEIRARLDTPSMRPIPEPPRTGRRVATAVVALAIFSVAATFAWVMFDRIGDDVPAADPWGWAPPGWTELPPPPEVRDGATIVWTGSELVYWGGTPRGAEGPASADGFAYDPDGRSWRSLAPAPVAGAFGEAAWTGEEVLVWPRDRRATAGFHPMAYDPSADTWRTFAASPHRPPWGGTWVWTGTELVGVGGGDRGAPSTREAVALDPADGTWRRLPDTPTGVNLADSVWTGDEVVVVGSEIDDRNIATTDTSVAMSYDPVSDSWRRLQDPPVSAQTAAVDLVGDRLIAWETYTPASARYVEDLDRWVRLPDGDLEASECYADGVAIPGVLFTWDCGRPAAWVDATGSWVRLASVPLADEAREYSVVRPFAAGPAVVVEQVETVADEDGVPSVGSPDAPVHLWLWMPPATLSTAA